MDKVRLVLSALGTKPVRAHLLQQIELQQRADQGAAVPANFADAIPACRAVRAACRAIRLAPHARVSSTGRQRVRVRLAHSTLF